MNVGSSEVLWRMVSLTIEENFGVWPLNLHQWWDSDAVPTVSQLGPMSNLIEVSSKKFDIQKIVGHRNLGGKTQCLGDILYPLIPKKGL